MMIDFDILWPKYQIAPYGVLHLGANTGQEYQTYKKHGVGQVIWVEAIPKVFDKLVENLKDDPTQSAMLLCVGDEEGKDVEFNISNNESQSSSILELGHHKIIHPEVHYVDKFTTKMHRLDVVLHPDSFRNVEWLLNADLQGAELKAFIGMGDLLKDFSWVYTEVNKKETYKGCALVEEVDEYLGRFGFVRIETGQWVADTWTDALYLKSK
jgi:FkbM family methyltransferase